VREERRVLVSGRTDELERQLAGDRAVPSFESAGPRERLFYDPARISGGIVTCGGLCPGLNNVIRSLVLTLTYAYGTRRILGFQYGYGGLSATPAAPPLHLTPDAVESIHESGGTLLGSSRGPVGVDEMVDTLARERVDILFAIGGDGTLRGAHAIVDALGRRGLPIAVIGIPKTIDNDLEWTERSFGFVTAVEEAGRVIGAAHAEARGAWNGVGLVKLMGRHSGFIAAHATLGNADVNFCLVPEVPFELDGDAGFLPALERRLAEKHHAVVVVAEGTGQDILRTRETVERDPSGNLRLKDVGVFLRDRIVGYCRDRGVDVTVRYIDPSYTIRSMPANTFDAEFCLRLGQYAVHAGMAGRTDMLVGYWNQHFTHVPIPVAVSERRQLRPDGDVWRSVLEATGQPVMVGAPEL
jgi:6-phosphofructokinase 1